ncbi:hypothetical protein [Bradyrhizobium sp. th.b2]|uniref:hypothetical protein n=1 Tax=Bradyrhizobium sp. th-b2 TaxID=172088 RepID=UPI0003FD4154|nr:hypothetical protein [Bradyrhizobium sp. th.b2]
MKSGPWDQELIDDEFDDTNVGDVLNTSRGERRAAPRSGGEYRRSNRYVEDGYGELDFA